jgi:hypothetical protein
MESRMTYEQKLYLRNHLISRWNKSPQWVSISTDDISFSALDNSINSITTDFSTIQDSWILITTTNTDSAIQGMYKVTSIATNKIVLDERFFTILEDEIAGPFVTIVPLICPIKFEGSSFAYPKNYKDFFVEYFLYPGYSKIASSVLDNKSSVRVKSDGWLKFLFHTPIGFGTIGLTIKRLQSVFKMGNLGRGIQVKATDEAVPYKDDQKEYLISTFLVELHSNYDSRDLQNEELVYNVQGFNTMHLNVEQNNSFIRFSAVYLNIDTGDYELTSLSDNSRASQIVIDSTSDKFIMQNSGPIKFIAEHGLPVGKIAWLAEPIDSDHANVVFEQPVSGKIQKLFEVVDPYQISIAIGEIYWI